LLRAVSISKARGSKRSPKAATSIKYKPDGPNRVTGAPNTSLSNSTNNIIGIIIASFGNFSDAAWAQVGFTAVMKRSGNISETTFLRGTWWPHLDGTERWGPLPSAMLKLGKVMSTVTKQFRLNQLAYGVSLGMVGIPEAYPILGNFRKRMHALGIEGPELRDKRKPIPDLRSDLDTEFIREWMTLRYRISRSDIISLEKRIDSIPSLPYFIGDEVFLRFLEDYL
jgi:hypothetical protein